MFFVNGNLNRIQFCLNYSSEIDRELTSKITVDIIYQAHDKSATNSLQFKNL